MAKDDIVIGLGRAMFGASLHNPKKKAYPSVITTLAPMDERVRRFMAAVNFLASHMEDASKMQKKFETLGNEEDYKHNDVIKTMIFQMKNMVEMYVVGISLGTAWAHPSSGDTVASVMVGGLKTVLVLCTHTSFAASCTCFACVGSDSSRRLTIYLIMQNGAFKIHTNDPICIYFEEEVDFFEENGARKNRNAAVAVDGVNPEETHWEMLCAYVMTAKLPAEYDEGSWLKKSDKLRKSYHDRGNGNYPATLTDSKFVGKTHIARYDFYSVHERCIFFQAYTFDSGSSPTLSQGIRT